MSSEDRIIDTPEGKPRSTPNAEKHGIYSSNIVLNGESLELYEEVRQHFYTRFQPAGKLEEYLLDQMVACHWRMNRMASLEAASIDHQMDCQQPEIADSFESIDNSTRAAIAFEKLIDSTSTLAHYRRFESALARQYDRAARHLAEIQKKSKNPQIEPNPKTEHSITSPRPHSPIEPRP